MEKQEFINRIIQEMVNLRSAFNGLNHLWDKQDDFGIDLNDYISRLYPFKSSFDELNHDVNDWVDDAVKNLKLQNL